MKPSTVAVLVLMFSALGLWGYSQMFPQSGGQLQSVMAAAAQVTAQPSETLTPSPAPSPTLDILMTAQIMNNAAMAKAAQADRDQAAVKVIEANSLGTQQAAVSTVQAADLANKQLESAILDKNAEIQRGNQTQAVLNIQYVNAAAAGTSTAIVNNRAVGIMTAEVPEHKAVQEAALLEIENKSKQDGWIDIVYLVGIPVCVFSVLVILFLAYKIARNWIGLIIDQRQYWRFNDELQRNPPETPNQAMPQAQPDMIHVQETQHNDGYIQAEQFDGPITPEQLVMVADAIVRDNKAFSRDTFVPDIMTRLLWDAFRRWCGVHDYAAAIRTDVANSPWYITSKGRRFLEGKATHSPDTREIPGFTPVTR
jgi:hypothetical protein